MLDIDYLEETALNAHAEIYGNAGTPAFRRAVLILLIGIAQRLDYIMKKG